MLSQLMKRRSLCPFLLTRNENNKRKHKQRRISNYRKQKLKRISSRRNQRRRRKRIKKLLNLSQF